VKRWLAGILSIALLLSAGIIGYFWIAGFSMAVQLLQGTPLFLEHAGHQFQVYHWLVLLVLTICPVAFTGFGIWLLRTAVRSFKSAA
jgi:hypothetical protein